MTFKVICSWSQTYTHNTQHIQSDLLMHTHTHTQPNVHGRQEKANIMQMATEEYESHSTQ